jgi:branched-chain amino acid transport system permease protein
MTASVIQRDPFSRTNLLVLVLIGAAGIAAPFFVESVVTQLTVFWVMVIIAYTWDTMGGQMGYNSFGNIVFFGVGMYVSAIVQIAPHTDLAAYTAAGGQGEALQLTYMQYYTGLALGAVAAGLAGLVIAAIIGSGILGLRGHYFAIGTLALGIFAAEMVSNWGLVGSGSGVTMPGYPGTDIASEHEQALVYYFLCFALAAATFLVLQWLYSTRFGLAINAIRDDEDKAEAMGIKTARYKTVAWSISGFFLGICGALFGNIVVHVDPRDTAFDGAGLGVWMVLMVVLGGKGTFWGPLIGAVLFHATKELFWSYLLGLQYIALGLLVVIIVVFFPEGIMGWFRARFPHWFGERVESAAPEEATRA